MIGMEFVARARGGVRDGDEFRTVYGKLNEVEALDPPRQALTFAVV
jgi:hypothetical protein